MAKLFQSHGCKKNISTRLGHVLDLIVDGKMYAWEPENSYGGITSIEERMKIMYNENIQSPTHSVPHYILYLRRYVSQPEDNASTSGSSNEKQTRSVMTDRRETRPVQPENQSSSDSISPLSYFIRKLKLDLKMAFPSFVEEFIQAPNNGLRLLLSLLKIVQSASLNPTGQINKAAAKGTLTMENYKQNMVDEQDCLLCIKYTLRIRAAVDEILENNSGLFIVTTCLLSNFSRSRIAALEILTLVITGPSSVDKVLDAFTSMRVRYGESTRFKMLIGMMHTRGVSHVLFQVSCLRLLNTILNLSKSANMRVFLQYEMEEAGLDWNRIQEGAQGDGLEYDDLRKEIREWRMRYIDVDSILRKIKADLKVDYPGSAVTEFHYDLHYGPANQGSVVASIEDFHVRRSQPDLSHWRHYEHRKDPMFSSTSILEQSTPFKGTSNKTSLKFGKPPRDELQTDLPLEKQSGKRTTDRVALNPVIPCLPGNAETDITDCSTAFNGKQEDARNNNNLSMTSGIYEPYGLLFKQQSHNYESGDRGSSDKNWILGTPVQEVRWTKHDKVNVYHKSGHDEVYRTETASDQYDSGVCVNYQDTEQGDELPQMCWKNFHPRRQLALESDDEIDDSRDSSNMNQQKEKHGQRNIICKNDTSEQGPLRWYNPRITYLHSINHPNSYNQVSNHKNHGTSNIIKPPTPAPDYSCDDIDNPELQFTPKLSSTIRSSVKGSPALNLIRAGNIHQKQTGTPIINTNSQFSRNTLTHDNHANKQASQFSQNNPQSQASPRPSLHDDYKHRTKPSFDNNQSTYTPPTSSERSTNMAQLILAKRTDSGFLKVPADSFNLNYSKGSHDDIRSTTPMNIPLSEHHKSNDLSMRSLASRQQIDEPSHRSQHLGETPRLKGLNSLRREEKYISRSLISLTANECEQTSQQNKAGKNCVHNINGNKMSTRRSSVSELIPTSERRNSLEAVTRFGITTKDDHKEIILREPSSSGQDSMRSYSAEIGRVLNDLDQALEKHGWQASLKEHVTQQRVPLIAYV